MQSTSNHCGLLINVLKGLGGASQEDQQPAFRFLSDKLPFVVGSGVEASANHDKLKFVGHFRY
jgi:hypothetical protein